MIFWAEIIAITAISISVCAMVLQHIVSKKAFGFQSIRLLGISVFSLIVLMLALEGFVGHGTAGILIGAFTPILFPFKRKAKDSDNA